jgi:tRNA dimethylallyltransferase
MSKKKLIIIAGPTAIGKTSLSIHIAKILGAEIISADSRQIYKELEIGTAKPNQKERDQIIHHFIDIVSIHDKYNVAKYEEEVISFLNQYFLHRDTAILTGGTGLYIKAIMNGLDELPTIPESVTQEITKLYELHGIAFLQNIVAEKDPVYFAKMDKDNAHRLMRAAAVIKHTGIPFTEFRKGIAKKRDFDIIPILLTIDRTKLYNRINQRVDLMIESGLEQEVKNLVENKELQALQTVGYKEFFQYFDGILSRIEAINKIKQHTRNYAKRQITWFNNQYKGETFLYTSKDKILEHIEHNMY